MRSDRPAASLGPALLARLRFGKLPGFFAASTVPRSRYLLASTRHASSMNRTSEGFRAQIRLG